jgi:AcrR family transcriptional regulator
MPMEVGTRKSRPRILAAALELAVDEQAGPLTMEAVASRAGVTRRTVYNHFANVSDLCLAACAPMFGHCTALLPKAIPDHRPARSRIHALALEIIAFQREPQHLRLRKVVKVQSFAMPALAEAYRGCVTAALERIAVQRLAGTSLTDVDPDLAERVIATLDTIGRLDYLVADLRRSGPGSVVVDLVLDQLGTSCVVHNQAA